MTHIDNTNTSFYDVRGGSLPVIGGSNLEYAAFFNYDHMSVQYVVESVAYGVARAVSEVGGMSGLLLGTKLLTFIGWFKTLISIAVK